MSAGGRLHLGINLPLPCHALRDHRPVIERLVDWGYTDVWTGEGGGVDGFTPLAAAAAWAPSLRVATGVLPVYTRGPAVLAQTAAALAELGDGEVVLGIGASVPAIVTAENGIPYDEPYKRVRDTLRFLKGAVGGNVVRGPFETFSIDAFKLHPLPPRPPRIILGALRAGMLKLAFTEGDGAITNILMAQDMEYVISTIDAPREGKELIVKVFVCPTADREFALTQGRHFLGHMLPLHTYKAFQEVLGRGDQLVEMNRRHAEGDVRGVEAAIPESIVDGLWVNGSPEACREQLERFLVPGVTGLNIYVAPTPELIERPDRLPEVLRALVPDGIGVGRS